MRLVWSRIRPTGELKRTQTYSFGKTIRYETLLPALSVGWSVVPSIFSSCFLR